jgi:hypothetical protein
MKRNNLIAIAVGTILGTALSAAYADDRVAPTPDNQQAAPQAPSNDDRQDVTSDRRDLAHARADIRADRQDIQRDRADLRADARGLRQEYPEQRAGENEQGDIARDQADINKDGRDIQRDRADIRADQQDIRRDRADLRADQRDVHGDHSDTRMARHGGPLPSTARMSGMNAAAHSGKVMAGTQRANGSAQRAHPAAANPQALTPTVMANNAVAEHKKPPSTQPVHQGPGGTGSGDRYEESACTERLRSVQAAQRKTRAARGSTARVTNGSGNGVRCAHLALARGTFPSWNNPEAEPPGIVFVPDAPLRLTAACHRCRIFIDIIVLF